LVGYGTLYDQDYWLVKVIYSWFLKKASKKIEFKICQNLF
jgi:hypothetical protein